MSAIKYLWFKFGEVISRSTWVSSLFSSLVYLILCWYCKEKGSLRVKSWYCWPKEAWFHSSHFPISSDEKSYNYWNTFETICTAVSSPFWDELNAWLKGLDVWFHSVLNWLKRLYELCRTRGMIFGRIFLWFLEN